MILIIFWYQNVYLIKLYRDMRVKEENIELDMFCNIMSHCGLESLWGAVLLPSKCSAIAYNHDNFIIGSPALFAFFHPNP